MTLTLILMRHAKSAWDNPALDDRERPLNSRGERDAPNMAAWLAAEGLVPSDVLVSSAERTRATWALAEAHLKSKRAVQVRDDLYHATAEHLFKTVRASGRGVRRLMVIGHNPGLEDFAKSLVGDGDKAARRLRGGKFPTAAIAVIAFEVKTWGQIEAESGQLLHFMTPKRLAKSIAR